MENGNGANRTRRPWPCEALPVSIKFTHNTIRNYSTTIFSCGYCGSYLIHSWHSPVTNRNRYCFNVKKCYRQLLLFFSSYPCWGTNVQVDTKRDPWSLLTALLIIFKYLNKMTDFIKDVGISYNIKNN
jgi:hypothetical protein